MANRTAFSDASPSSIKRRQSRSKPLLSGNHTGSPFCAGHWGPELVEIAGGIDVLGRKHQKSAQIEWEQVLAARPEVIVLALCGYEASRARQDLNLLRTFPHFNELPAARDNRIHVVDANAYFFRPGPRIVDSLEVLARILHPKKIPPKQPSTTHSTTRSV